MIEERRHINNDLTKEEMEYVKLQKIEKANHSGLVENNNGPKAKTGKRNELKISTWNIRLLLEPGNFFEVVTELERYQIDLQQSKKVVGRVERSKRVGRFTTMDMQKTRSIWVCICNCCKK